ncbi:MAG TPA: nucleotidyltransferase domain-containing protein, partial [Armatimonadota bacterium]|nr:nucleotidyltransferase domain-containing protein [Armatimonadota bacterium]
MSGSFYSPEYRQATLDRMLDALKADERIIGVLVVGSGAVGFDDNYSDIDLCIVCPDDQTLSIYQDWRERFEKLLPVIHCCPVTYNPSSHLYALLLDGFLELDAGFIGMGSLTAKRERWKVAFDRSGKIASIMTASWESRPPTDLKWEYLRRVEGIWHHVLHVGSALRRGQPWKTLHYLETIRNRTIELAVLRRGLDIGHFREVDRLPEDLLAELQETFPTKVEDSEIIRALDRAIACFFREARAYDEMLG